MEKISISVVIPAYQSELFIAKTLNSVAQQSHMVDEVLVIDDGSVDQTCEIVEDFISKNQYLRIRLLRMQHKGPGAARNVGVRAAKYEWIAFLDSDDLWCAEKISCIVNTIELNPSCNFVFHNEITLEINGFRRFVQYTSMYDSNKPLPRQLFIRNFFSTSTVVCRKDLLIKYGLFDETLTSAQDFDLWLHLSPHIRLAFTPAFLGIYVMRNNNISSTRYWRRFLNILRVRFKHRKLVSFHLFAVVLLRILVAKFFSPLRTIFARFFS